MMQPRSVPWLALCLAVCAHAARAAEAIQGAGATFPAPVYAAWAAAFEQSGGERVGYQAVGSGQGIERIRRCEVDFGATDAPLTAEELDRDHLLQFPVIVGGVVPVINITGIRPGELRLDGRLLADIYLGRIRKWNDGRIAALNPGLALPNTRITVVHRREPSGTSLMWTDYLSRSSPEWRAAVGMSLLPNWPTGVGGTGNEGVASFVQRTRHSLGYVEYIYARRHHLSDVALRNSAGEFVQAGGRGFAAAAQSADWSARPGYSQLPTDLPGSETWPVTGVSFILVCTSPERAVNTRRALRFFNWGLHEGEAISRTLDYLPVPQKVVDQLPALWDTIVDGSGRRLWSQDR